MLRSTTISSSMEWAEYFWKMQITSVWWKKLQKHGENMIRFYFTWLLSLTKIWFSSEKENMNEQINGLTCNFQLYIGLKMGFKKKCH